MWWPTLHWIPLGVLSDWLGVAVLATAAVLFVMVIHHFAVTEATTESPDKRPIWLSYGILVMLGAGLALNPGGDRSAITKYVGVAAGWALFLSYSLKVRHDQAALQQTRQRLNQDRALSAQAHAQTEQRLLQDRVLNARAHSQTEQRLLQERLLKACEQLGSCSPASRAAALIVLERIAAEADSERPYVVRIAAQFLRSISIPTPPDSYHRQVAALSKALVVEAKERPTWESWLVVLKSALSRLSTSDTQSETCSFALPGDAVQAMEILRSCARNSDQLDLRDIRCVDASLAEARWAGSRLDGSYFVDSDITTCTWKGVQAERINLSKCCLQGGNFEDANFQRAVLTGTAASNGFFARADFSHAKILATSDFSQAHCQGVILRNSTLKDVSFRGADLRDAIFDEAELENVDFAGAEVTWDQLLKAKVRIRLKGEMVPVEEDPLKGVVAAQLDGQDILGGTPVASA